MGDTEEAVKLPLTYHDYVVAIGAIAKLKIKAADAGDSEVVKVCSDAIGSLLELKRKMRPLEHSCWNCCRPHSRYDQGLGHVFCYPGSDEDESEHAHEVHDAKMNVCENWKGKAKRSGWCLYRYGCDCMREDGKCGLTTWCKRQGNKREKDAGVKKS